MNSSYAVEEPLRGIVTIEIEAEEIAKEVNKQINDACKNLEIPGFRKGKVPKSLVERKYGEDIRMRVASEKSESELMRLMKEKEVNSITAPLAEEFGLKDNGKYNFRYICPLVPNMEATLDSSVKLPFYIVEPTDKDIDARSETLRMSHATTVEVDKMGEKDSLQGKLVELNEEGAPLEGGLVNEYTLVVPAYFMDAEETKKFEGAVKGAAIRFNPAKAYADNSAILKRVFNTPSNEEALKYKGDFLLTIDKIESLVPATLDEDFYKKLFGEETGIKDEEGYRKEIEKGLKDNFASDAKSLFRANLMDTLIENTAKPAVDTETIRKILEVNIAKNNEGKSLSQEEITDELNRFVRYIYYRELVDQLLKKLEITISEEQIKEQVHQNVLSDLARYGYQLPNMEGILDQLVAERMKDESYVERAVALLKEELVAEKAYELVTREEKKVTPEEYHKIVEEYNKQREADETKEATPTAE